MYFCSYAALSARYSFLLATVCFLKFNLPRSSSDTEPEPDFPAYAFACLYRARYFFSYTFRSTCNSLRFLSTYSRRFNLPEIKS